MYIKLIGVSLLFVIACNTLHRHDVQSGNKSSKSNISCVKLSQLFPVIMMEGKRSKFIQYDTGIAFIYTFNNQMIIKSSYHFDSLFSKNSDKPPAFRELRYYTLVFTKGHKYGSFTDEHKQLYDVKVNVDSVREDEWTSQLYHLYDNFLENWFTLRSASTIAGTDTLKEMYSYINQKDTMDKGTMELFYSTKVPNIAFSLSPQLDSIKQRQLCKVFFTVNARYYKDRDIQADAFSVMYDMKAIPMADKDTAAIMDIFRRDKWGDD
jgi:hypothetical protein